MSLDYEGNTVATIPSIGAYEYGSTPPPTAIPVYVSSVIENATPNILTITYSLNLANIRPATSDFIVMVNSVARPVNSVTISGNKVLLTLTTPVVYGDIITVSYNKPSSNPLQTASGGQAASIIGQNVTNNCHSPSPVYISSVIENATPSVLEMTYSLNLADIVPSIYAFNVMVNSVTQVCKFSWNLREQSAY